MRAQAWVFWDFGVAVILLWLLVRYGREYAEIGGVWLLALVIVLALAAGAHLYSASRYWRRWRRVRDEQAKREAQVMYEGPDGEPEPPCGLHRFDEHHSRYCHLRRDSTGTTHPRHMTFVRPAPTADEAKREWLSKGATGPHPSPRGLADEIAFAWDEWSADGSGGNRGGR